MEEFVDQVEETRGKYIVARNQGGNAGASVPLHNHNHLFPRSGLEHYLSPHLSSASDLFIPADIPKKKRVFKKEGLDLLELDGWIAHGWVLDCTTRNAKYALNLFLSIFAERAVHFNLVGIYTAHQHVKIFIFPRTKKIPDLNITGAPEFSALGAMEMAGILFLGHPEIFRFLTWSQLEIVYQSVGFETKEWLALKQIVHETFSQDLGPPVPGKGQRRTVGISSYAHLLP